MKSKQSKLIAAIGVLILLGTGYLLYSQANQSEITTTDNSPNSKGEVVNNVSLAWDESTAKVPLSEILTGCPGKDCIPSIDNPVFESIEQANTWMKPEDRVFILSLNSETKIYPQRIMNWHEIVNDWFADTPIAITYCPLCGSSVAFERRIDGTTTQFGVSGKLHNNDLVMYDRLEGSLWQQITGEAIVGPAAVRDEVLTPKLLTISSWEQASQKHPDAQVLSTDTGYARDYDLFPYGSYETNTQIGVAPQSGIDDRLHPKTWVYGIRVGKTAVAFLEEDLSDSGEISYIDNGLDLTVLIQDNQVSITDNNTGDQIIPTRLFWFAWAAFNPDTSIGIK